jgi:putative ABC transport system permease protein
VGAGIAVAGIVAVSIVAGSARTLLDTPQLWGATWDAVTRVEQEEDLAGAAELLAGDPDVEAVALGQGLANPDIVSAEGPTDATAVDPFAFQPVKGHMGPVVTDGRAPVGPDEAAVGFALAERLGVGPGDELVLRTPRVAVPVTMVGTLVFPGHNELGDRLVLTPEGLDSLRAGCGPDSEELSCVVEDHDLGVRYRPGVDVATATARLAGEVGGLRLPQPPSEVNNLDQIGVTPWLLAGFLALLGLAGLAHALVIGSRRQRRDLGVLRALGLRPGQAVAVIRWQGVVLTVLGSAAGLLFGLLAGRLVWQNVAEGIGALVHIELSLWSVAAVLPATVLAGVLAASVPAHRVGRQRPADVLRTE